MRLIGCLIAIRIMAQWTSDYEILNIVGNASLRFVDIKSSKALAERLSSANCCSLMENGPPAVRFVIMGNRNTDKFRGMLLFGSGALTIPGNRSESEMRNKIRDLVAWLNTQTVLCRPEVSYRIVNYVARRHWSQIIDTHRISEDVPSSFHPPSIDLRINQICNPVPYKAFFKIFPNGRVLSMGTKSVEQLEAAFSHLACLLDEYSTKHLSKQPNPKRVNHSLF